MKKIISGILCFCMAVSVCLFSACSEEDKEETIYMPVNADKYIRIDENNEEIATGKYVLFGVYPQSEVSDSEMAALDAEVGDLPTNDNNFAWTSYQYYVSGSNTVDYMWYQDITYNQQQYRGVYFTSYRPVHTNNGNSRFYQQENGYSINKIYWFRFEPIKWKILEEKEGYATILCEMLIDSQAYQNTYTKASQNEKNDTAYNYAINNVGNIITDKSGNKIYANNYEYSTLRYWLNDVFYHTAFKDLEKAIIQKITVDNSAATTGERLNAYACANTLDKVWLLSYKEATTYFKSETERQKKATEYARCQGIYASVSTDDVNNGYWWLRSPLSNYSNFVQSGYNFGIQTNYYEVGSTNYGVVPTLKIRL